MASEKFVLPSNQVSAPKFIAAPTSLRHLRPRGPFLRIPMRLPLSFTAFAIALAPALASAKSIPEWMPLIESARIDTSNRADNALKREIESADAESLANLYSASRATREANGHGWLGPLFMRWGELDAPRASRQLGPTRPRVD